LIKTSIFARTAAAFGVAAALFSPVVALAQTATAPVPPASVTPAAPSVLYTAPAVPRAECFPVETLPADLRPLAEQLLLKMLDSEALYTIVGGMKPMSSGYVHTMISVTTPNTTSIERTRQALSALRCGDWFRTDLLMFRNVNSDKRYVEGVVVCVPTYRRMVNQYASFWAPWGITPHTDPSAAIVFAENDPTSARNRALGYLYGYPRPAVDFFVASMDADSKNTGAKNKITPRDFRQIPTFSSPIGQFVYAIPKGTPISAEDKALSSEAARILAAYKVRRERYIGDGKPGVVALLRDWFSDGQGNCSPLNARVYELVETEKYFPVKKETSQNPKN
jgi:hypothetical protein